VRAIAKSLLFLADGEPVLVICAGDRRVDTGRVGELVGASQVKMAPPEEVRRVTGFAIGGVPPLGHATPIRTLMDRRLIELSMIYAAAGAHDALFPVDPKRLLEVSGAQETDISI
jgi:prolyl-tRNA editing enzyme YbaK/EbsC (Cys-tRNA(Pro) deacylase)